jgi:translation initiation factor 1
VLTTYLLCDLAPTGDAHDGSVRRALKISKKPTGTIPMRVEGCADQNLDRRCRVRHGNERRLAGIQQAGEPGAQRGARDTTQRVRVQRTKAGKGGKLVTAITGLEAPEAELKTLLKQLKAVAGTGGTFKDGVIELQGDQVAPALAALEKEGYRPKQAGG